MSAARPDTWMPLYIGDYLADTLHLSREQHGSYLLLIFAMWRAGGALADDDRRLAAIAKATPRQWREDCDVLKEFFVVADGAWRHKRVDHELQAADTFIRQRSGAGKASADARRRQREGNERSTTVERNGQRKGKTSPSPSPSPSPSQSSEGSLRSPSAPAGAPSRDVIFAECLPWLIQRTGKTRDQAAKLIGSWCRDYGDDAVLAAMRAAEADAPVDPVPWIVAKFKPRETWEQRRQRENMAVIDEYARLHGEGKA